MKPMKEAHIRGNNVGRARRLSRLFSPVSGRTIIVPIDDGLIFGPFNGLQNLFAIGEELYESKANAVLAFPGAFRAISGKINGLGWIVNLTASTAGSSHTRKVMVGSVEQAVRFSAEAVAVHVNLTDENEREMLKILGETVRESEQYQIPVVAIMYPRRASLTATDNYDELKLSEPDAYSRLVAHAVRVGVELGADLVKTKYTGTVESFHTVVQAALDTPVVIAGGELIERQSALQMAKSAIAAGASGISFGRNVYQRKDIREFISDMNDIVHAAPRNNPR